MNTKDVAVIGDVLHSALEGHRKVLETLIEARTQDHITVERAKALALEASEAAEERLQEFTRLATSEVARTLQEAAAEDVVRLRDELRAKAGEAETIARDVAGLRDDLAQVVAALDAQPTAEDIAQHLKADAGLREALRGDPGKDGDKGTDGLHGAGIDAVAWAPGIFRAGTLVQAY
ncbi:MAG: hypothetical protein ABW123_09005, partial [Cystobacter sp.]